MGSPSVASACLPSASHSVYAAHGWGLGSSIHFAFNSQKVERGAATPEMMKEDRRSSWGPEDSPTLPLGERRAWATGMPQDPVTLPAKTPVATFFTVPVPVQRGRQ